MQSAPVRACQDTWGSTLLSAGVIVALFTSLCCFSAILALAKSGSFLHAPLVTRAVEYTISTCLGSLWSQLSIISANNMSFLSPLPAEIRNKIIALSMPMCVTVAPCKTGSPIAAEKTLKHSKSHSNVEKSRTQIVYRKLTTNRDKEYVYEDEQAQAYGALLLTNRTINHELAVQFYGSNNFAFPSCQFFRPFIRNLSTTTLSYLRTISLSIYLHETTRMWHPSREWNPIPDIDPLITQLSCLRRCGNLELLSSQLEAQSCKVQSYVFDWFLSEGRNTIGPAPSIRVAFFFCEICTTSEKSQHWRWSNASGSHLWEVTNFIGSAPVRVCPSYPKSQTLACNTLCLLSQTSPPDSSHRRIR